MLLPTCLMVFRTFSIRGWPLEPFFLLYALDLTSSKGFPRGYGYCSKPTFIYIRWWSGGERAPNTAGNALKRKRKNSPFQNIQNFEKPFIIQKVTSENVFDFDHKIFYPLEMNNHTVVPMHDMYWRWMHTSQKISKTHDQSQPHYRL